MTGIKQYIERIGYTGIIKTDLETLASLQKNHLLSIPFENLDIHYHKPIILNVDHFYNKVVLQKRGGFCYELNGLFHSLLIELGFDANMVSARVHTGDGNYGPEYDHLAIIVCIGGRNYLADVGFGEFAFAPIEIKPGTVQEDERGKFRVEEYKDGYYRVSKEINSKITPEYIFIPVKRELQDFEAMCYYHQTSPQSHFTQRKLVTIPRVNGRVTIAGDQLILTDNGNVVNEKILGEDGIRRALKKYFNIELYGPGK